MKLFDKIIAVLCVAALMAIPILDRQSFAVAEDCSFCAVIDAGHGGADGGAVSLTQRVPEAGINLNVALKLSVLLEAASVKTVLTRSDDNALCRGEYSKQTDMQLRGEVITAARPDIVISIHMNSYPDPHVRGAQTFYYPGSECGRELARCIQNGMTDFADNGNKRQIKEEDFFMLRVSESPAALVECGFISCPEEEKLLLSDEYCEKIAYGIYIGIMRYLYLHA